MNKSELVDALAVHYEGSRVDAARALQVFVSTISSATAAGERVAITGFGVFERVERPARTVRNPRTGERLDVPATAVPRFRPGTELKAYVSGQRAVPDLPPAPAARPRPTAADPQPAAEEVAKPAKVAKVAKPAKVAKASKVAKPAKVAKASKVAKPAKSESAKAKGKKGTGKGKK